MEFPFTLLVIAAFIAIGVLTGAWPVSYTHLFSDQDTGTKDKKIFYPYRKKAGSAEGLQDRKGAAGDSSCA